MKFLPLLCSEGLGMILLMSLRRIAATVASDDVKKTRQAARRVDHQDFCRRVAVVALGQGLDRASRQIEQAVESFVGLDCRDLMGGRMSSHFVFYPPLEPRPTGLPAAAKAEGDDNIGAD